MTFLATPRAFTHAEFQSYVAGLHWAAWKPTFVTQHNTGVPNLRQWPAGLTVAQEIQRVVNQKHFEKDINHWHSGVHLFASPAPDRILQLSDLLADAARAAALTAEAGQ